MIRVLIADDHEIVRRGIRQILTEGFSFVHIDEAPDCTELIVKATREEWDIIISDIAMPGGGGVEALRHIKKTHPLVPVLILSTYPAEQYAVKMIKAGASGYLNKDSAPETLVTAIQRILDGKRYITGQVAEELAGQLNGEAGALPHQLLSEREIGVFRLLASGKSVSAIGSELSLNPTTVSTYRARILEKTGMKTNADIIRYAIENNLI
ncbi:MAG: response regulator [Bacteroidota bacterium]